MKIKLLALIFIIAIFSTLSFASTWWTGTPDFVLNETADFVAGQRTNVSTYLDRYNQSQHNLQIDFPYASRDANLVSYWRFSDSGATITDELGTNDMTKGAGASEPAFTANGKFDSAYDFTSAVAPDSDRLYMSGKPDNSGTGSWSVWINNGGAYADGVYSQILGYGNSGNQHLMRLHVVGEADGDGFIYFDHRAATYRAIKTATGTITQNQWHHVVVTADASTWKIYIDGVYKSVTGTNVGDWFSDLTDSGTTYTSIGAWWYTPGSWQGVGWDGKIDEVKLYDDALTQTEVTELYNNGKQYIDTEVIGVASEWVSDDITIPADRHLLNLTINMTNTDSNSGIDWIYIKDADTSLTNTTDICSDGLITFTTDEMTGDFSDITGDFNITLGLTGNGTSTPIINDIIGYYEDAPVILSVTMVSPINTSYCGDYVWINGTTNLAAEWCGYSIDGLTNVTLTNSSGNWNGKYRNYNCSDNSHNVTLYCNTTLGVEDASPTVWFWSCCCSETYDWVYIPFLIMISIFIFIFYKIDGEGGLFDHPIKFIFIGLALLFSWVLLSSLYLLAVQDSAAISEQLSIVISSYMWLIVFLTFSFMLLFIKHIVNSRNKEEE